MPRKLSDEGPGETISPLIDVVMNAFAAMFIILVIYISVFQDVPVPEPLRFLDVEPPPAIRGQNYTFTLPVAGGVGTRSFKLISGDLAALNFQFDTNTGTIFGVANTKHDRSQTDSVSFPIKIECEIEVADPKYRATRRATFNMSSGAVPYPDTMFTIIRQDQMLPGGRMGRGYEAVFAASGGVEPYRWELVAGKIPQGLNLDTNQGRIYGKPSESGSFTFGIKAAHVPGAFSADGVPYTWAAGVSTGRYELVVHDILKHSLQLPIGRVGESYVAAVVSNGKLPEEQLSWEAQVPGLTFSETNGSVTGIPQRDGNFKVSYRIKSGEDNLGSGESDLIVLPLRPIPETGAAVFNMWTGEPVEYRIPYRGLHEPVAITNLTALPLGLWIDGNMLKGTPSAPAVTTVNLLIKDALDRITNGNLTLRIAPPRERLEVTSPAEVRLVVGQDVTWQPSIRGGEGPTHMSLDGELAPGLLFTNNQLRGIARWHGEWTNSLVVEDLILGTVITQKVTFRAVFEDETVPRMLTTSVPPATMLVPYELVLAAEGGVGLLRFDVIGNLPAGLQFTNHALVGTPGVAGIWPLSITATDEATQTSKPIEVAIVVKENKPRLLAKTIPTAFSGKPFEFSFPLDGGIPPFQLKVEGQMPTGLSSSEFGLTGTPTTVGSQQIQVSIIDSVGQQDGPIRYNLNVERGDQSVPELITSTNLPKAFLGARFDLALATVGGIGRTRLSFDGDPPPGLVFSESGISGTPTSTGNFVFGATAFDEADQESLSRRYRLVVERPEDTKPTVVSRELPPAVPGQKYVQTLAAEGGVGRYRWSIDGKLPPGLRVTNSGIEGALSPVQRPAKWPITVFVRDDAGQSSSTNTLDLIVVDSLDDTKPTVATRELPPGMPGQKYVQTFAAEGGVGKYHWKIIGKLPPGLSTTSNGIGGLLGLQQASGKWPIVVSVTDDAGQSSSAYTLELFVLPQR